MHEMLKEIMDENLRRIGSSILEAREITFAYTNWQGETRVRNAIPYLLYYGTCEPWHKEEGWLMKAMDTEISQQRTFSVKDMTIEEGGSR